jgi:hypothetical protein
VTEGRKNWWMRVGLVDGIFYWPLAEWTSDKLTKISKYFLRCTRMRPVGTFIITLLERIFKFDRKEGLPIICVICVSKFPKFHVIISGLSEWRPGLCPSNSLRLLERNWQVLSIFFGLTPAKVILPIIHVHISPPNRYPKGHTNRHFIPGLLYG